VQPPPKCTEPYRGQDLPYPIESKLVIAVASSALFDLRESDAVFQGQGEEPYRAYQREHQDDVLQPGVAFPFIRRLLSLNGSDPSDQPVEVILLSRNDPDTGLRVFNSIQSHGLTITRGAFVTGKPAYRYAPAFNASLFLSANENDVRAAMLAGQPSGLVLHSAYEDDMADEELRVAFDFDGVLADDEAEAVFHNTGDLGAFHQAEQENVLRAHNAGPLKELLIKIAALQQRERARVSTDKLYESKVRIAIVTARNAPSHKRMITSLREWGIQVDETFFLGGIEKRRILEVFAPHIFFDDQRVHLDPASGLVPSVHVPFGIKNVEPQQDAIPIRTSETSGKSTPR
jgi:5'-nucleotidase